MASFWLLKLALKGILHFAWPLVALGYPLCASIQAIETDSYKETRDLLSYWILLSLIYLFEYAFLRLLQWFLFWPYIKLMVISWLIVPDFGRASYVYNTFIRSYVSINPQAVICWLNNWKKFFVKKDNFLLHAERYIKQNGTEGLEKLIASKKSTTYKPDAEVTNAVKAIDNKELLQKSTTYKPDAVVTNTVKAIDNKEMLQKSTTYKPDEEVTTAVKVIDNKDMLQKSTTYKPDAEVTNAVKATDNKEMLQKSTAYKPDAEVTNAVKAIDNKDMLQGTTYKPDTEATNAVRAIDSKEMQQANGKKLQTEPKDIRDLEVIEKKEIPAGKQDIAVMPNLAPSQNTSSATVKTDGTDGEELPQRYTHNKVQKEWTCALCQVTTSSEETLNSHLHGRKHRATLEALKAKNQSVPLKQNSDPLKEEVKQTIINQLNSENKKLGNIVNDGLKEKEVKNHRAQELQKSPCQPVGTNHTKLRCEICNITCPGEGGMKSHLNGRKHLAKIKNLNLQPPTN